MSTPASIGALCGALLSLCPGAITLGQVPPSPLEIKSIAEVESGSKLIPADRVVPGDHVIYTLEVRNAGATAVEAPTVTYAIPEHMRYVADSAVGPGAEVSFSMAAGHHFERPATL